MRLFNVAKPVSSMVVAIALATGVAVVGSGVIADPAHAQRKKKDPKPEYSKEFIGGYQPLNEAVNAEGADIAALRPQMNALLPLAQSDDEKNALGGLLFNAGVSAQDQSLQLQGMELMLASNKVGLDQVARFNFIAYQLSNAQNDFTKARTYLQRAIDLNFSTPNVSSADMQIAMAENFFAENRFREGLTYLSSAIEDRKAQRQSIEENWYRRGLTVAYNNEIVPEVYDFVVGWIGDYGSPTNWRDAINLTRNLNDFQQPEMLDLLRLARQTGALSDASDYDYYIEAADARRLPQEVKEVIEEGKASGVITAGNLYATEQLDIADGRIASDRSELPAFEADALKPDARLTTVKAAADTLLSYSEWQRAAVLYEKALAMPGVEKDEVTLRLGIAQIGMEDHSTAQETFAKVEGSRERIAMLWSAYATAQGAASAPAPKYQFTTG